MVFASASDRAQGVAFGYMLEIEILHHPLYGFNRLRD